MLLDADVVIRAFELGIWDKLVAKYEVALARTVCEQEVKGYYDEAVMRQKKIDLGPYIADGRVTVADAELDWVAEVSEACRKALGSLHGYGELESVAIVKHHDRQTLFCSADGYAVQLMAVLGLAEEAISMEHLLKSVGLSRRFDGKDDIQFSEVKFRHYLKQGRIRLAQTLKL
ncbi:MAG: hypothetical protein R6X13_04215 [bacterium]